MHWCADETAALVGSLGALRLAWAWLKNKYNLWRKHEAQAHAPHRSG